MKSLVDRLASYAEYHRDKRNIATHFVGIPMILVGTQATLARIGIGPINPAVGATGLATRYYRQLDPTYGNAMAAVLGATCAIGTSIAALPMPLWAGAAASLFVGGWALQFLGHYFEGEARVPRRPARPARRPAVPRRRDRVRARPVARAARRGPAPCGSDALGQIATAPVAAAAA